MSSWFDLSEPCDVQDVRLLGDFARAANERFAAGLLGGRLPGARAGQVAAVPSVNTSNSDVTSFRTIAAIQQAAATGWPDRHPHDWTYAGTAGPDAAPRRRISQWILRDYYERRRPRTINASDATVDDQLNPVADGMRAWFASKVHLRRDGVWSPEEPETSPDVLSNYSASPNAVRYFFTYPNNAGVPGGTQYPQGVQGRAYVDGLPFGSTASGGVGGGVGGGFGEAPGYYDFDLGYCRYGDYVGPWFYAQMKALLIASQDQSLPGLTQLSTEPDQDNRFFATADSLNAEFPSGEAARADAEGRWRTQSLRADNPNNYNLVYAYAQSSDSRNTNNYAYLRRSRERYQISTYYGVPAQVDALIFPKKFSGPDSQYDPQGDFDGPEEIWTKIGTYGAPADGHAELPWLGSTAKPAWPTFPGIDYPSRDRGYSLALPAGIARPDCSGFAYK